MIAHKEILLGLITTTWLCGCSEGGGPFDNDDNIEKKPTSVYDREPLESGRLTLEEKPVRAATVKFQVKLTTESEFVPCRGNVTVDIMSNFQMQFPAAVLRCLSLEIDVQKILSFAAPKMAMESLSSDGNVLLVSDLGPAHFEPARPLLVGPLIQNPAKYRGFVRKSQHQLTLTSPVTGQTVTDSGQLEVKVLEVESKFQNELLNETFSHVLRWQMTATGFERVAGADAFIFDKLEFYFNARPIMIPKIVIEGTMGDFMSEATVGAKFGSEKVRKMGDQFLGKLKLELIAESYQMN